MADLKPFEKEYQEVLSQLSSPELLSDWERFQELSKRKDFLEKIFEKEKEIKEISNRIAENKAIISAGEDQDLVSLAETEISQLQEKEKSSETELENMVKQTFEKENISKESVKSENSDVIVEIRAGTGGEEAALFAGDLFKMYSRYAEGRGWNMKVLEQNNTDMGGFKEIVFELRSSKSEDKDVFRKMKYEGGVHRVQRIPTTEKSGRIHTSTVTVAVLIKPKKTEFKIRPEDIKLDLYCASGPGGQYVNKRETAVRLTHIPTGTVVTSQTERNQLQNRENAMAILEARIQEKKKQMEEEKFGDKRRIQIGGAERSEKIRTYNFPQNRLTDHRIKKSWHNLEKIMEGELEPIISAMQESET